MVTHLLKKGASYLLQSFIDNYLKMDKRNKFESDIIRNGSVTDRVLQGKIFLPSLNEMIAVEADPETDNPDTQEFYPLIEELKKLNLHLTAANYDKLTSQISEEITESAYEQDEYDPTDEDIQSLQEDLALKKITIFPEGFLMEYTAQKIFPGNTITVQLSGEFDIDDVAVN